MKDTSTRLRDIIAEYYRDESKPLFTQKLLKDMQAIQAKEWREFWQANENKENK
jgi:hypothetical protein